MENISRCFLLLSIIIILVITIYIPKKYNQAAEIIPSGYFINCEKSPIGVFHLDKYISNTYKDKQCSVKITKDNLMYFLIKDQILGKVIIIIPKG